MKKIWVGTGWKMNHLRQESAAYAQQLKSYVLESPPSVQVFILPPFTSLQLVSEILAGTPVWVGAQNMHWDDRGAATGEISPLMLKECGVSLVELGHSERRAYFGETDQTVNAKVLAALRHDLCPLICIGETAEEKAHNNGPEILARQVRIALNDVVAGPGDQILFAYEPVWAIGEKGVPADPDYANQMQGWIRSQIEAVVGPEKAAGIPVLYGGSVNQSNAADLINQPNVDGLFIGRSAWQPGSFIKIIELIENAEKARQNRRW
jgi:triosephosphate isomerase